MNMENIQVSLVGFLSEQVFMVGTICLPAYIESVNQMVKFIVVNCLSTYNAILERPWIHAMKAVSSTYNQVIRFPTKKGVREIQGDQKALRECYNMVLRSKQQFQQLQVEGSEGDNREEKEELEEEEIHEVPLDPSDCLKVTNFGAILEDELRSELVAFLKKNIDFFEWLYLDIGRIDRR